MDQAYNYEHYQFADYSVYQDIFLLQACSILVGAEPFYNAVLQRYQARDITLFNVPQTDASAKIEDLDMILGLEEDFMRLILTLFLDRTNTGMSETEVCRKHILHSLFASEQSTYSHITKRIPKQYKLSQPELEEIIASVADYHKPKTSNDQGYFTVKQICWREFDPYFISYRTTKPVHLAEDNYKHINSKDPLSPHLEQPKKPYPAMNRLYRILHTDILHRAIFTILYRTVVLKSFVTEDLLLSSIHALVLATESWKPGHEKSKRGGQSSNDKVTSMHDIVMVSDTDITANAVQSIKMPDGNTYSIISLLAQLAESKDRINNILPPQKLVKRVLDNLANLDETCKQVLNQKRQRTELSSGTGMSEEEERLERKRKAMERQKLIMQQFAQKQQKFDEKFGSEMDEDDDGLSVDSATSTNSILFDDQRCAFCHDTISPNGHKDFAMLSHTTRSGSLRVVSEQNYRTSHDKPITLCSFEHTDEKSRVAENPSSGIYREAYSKRHDLDCMKSVIRIGRHEELFRDIHVGDGVQVNHCSHVCHFDCFDRYFNSIRTQAPNLRTAYKGYGITNLKKVEILCPVCGRLVNSLCPILPQPAVSDDDMDEEGKCLVFGKSSYSLLGNTEVTSVITFLESEIEQDTIRNEVYKWENESGEFSLRNSLKTFFNNIAAEKLHIEPTALDDENDTHFDPIIMASTVAYNIATQECEQREEDSYDLRLNTHTSAHLRALMEASYAHQQFNADTRQMAHDHVQKLVSCIRGDIKADLFDKTYEEEEEGKQDDEETEEAYNPSYLPLLSCDPFSMLVRLLLLRPDTLRFDRLKDAITLFYKTQIIQALLVLQYRYGVQVPNSNIFANQLSFIEEKLKKTGGSLPKLVEPEVLNTQLLIDFVKQATVTYLRRVTLLIGICFNADTFPHSIDMNDQFDNLIRYIQLPTLEQVSQSWSENDTQPKQWLEQLFISIHRTLNNDRLSAKQKKELPQLVKSLVPRFSRLTRPFHFVPLPKLYQTLFLKYHKAQCPNCGKSVVTPVLCLCCGQVLSWRQCRCRRSEVGNCTQHARENYCGTGLYLLIPMTKLFLVRDGRRSILNSPYLDQHGEEDIDLTRGVALYLNQQRYKSNISNFILNSWDQDTVILRMTDNANVNQF
jgi:hypothetical protein